MEHANFPQSLNIKILKVVDEIDLKNYIRFILNTTETKSKFWV